MYENDEEEKRSVVGKVLKIVALTLIFGIILFILLRIAMGDYYPKSMKKLFVTDNLTDAYRASPSDYVAYTQEINTPFFRERDGLALYFASHMIYLPGAGEIQFTLRTNTGTVDRFAQKYQTGSITNAFDPSLFAFILRDNRGNAYPLQSDLQDKFMFYRYDRLSYTGVDFDDVRYLYVDICYRGEIPDGVKVDYDDALGIEGELLAGMPTEDGVFLARIYVYEQAGSAEYVRAPKPYSLSSSEIPQ